MFRNFILSVIVSGALSAALASGASAGECGRKPCDQDRRGQIEFDDPGRGEGDFSGERQREKKRRKERRQIEIYSQPSSYGDDRFVQNNESGGGLIGPTEALTQALAAVPGGKALGVKLLKGPTPVYAVKLRVRGKVRRILVDARTAQVLGE
jgi:uncharacterized membrane protein YkoI